MSGRAPIYNPKRSLNLLRLGTQNPAAVFRDGQEDAIKQTVKGQNRLLVVQRTGWGKSAVYFIATKLLREQGTGPAILISPLLALMRNQIAAAERMGIRAKTINSENKLEWHTVEALVQRDEVDILLISPERLANDRFNSEVLQNVAGRISLIVVDEAHCISDWGHDFRPHYRLIERILRALPHNLRVLATTATANSRVLEDLKGVLGPNLVVVRGELGRESLHLQTMRLPSQAERMAWIAAQVPSLDGSGIIYTLTVRDADRLAGWLQSKRIAAEAYTSESGERRVELEDALLANHLKVLVATTALGMGFDKPDLGFVIHYQTPGSVVAYYQQVGRAGRAIAVARGVLLSGSEEKAIGDYFIESAFPSREEVSAVVNALLEAPEGLTVTELMTRLNIRFGRLDKALKLMSLEAPAPIVKDGTRWRLTAASLPESFWQRAQRLTKLRRAEQREMQKYVALESGHMTFLIRALNGTPSHSSGPLIEPLSCAVNRDLVNEATDYLRRTILPLEPRRKWPNGGLPSMGVNGTIEEKYRAQEGRVLSIWDDAGWGELVRKGKVQDCRFADALVDACAVMVRTWNPSPFPQWVTCVPSMRHPELVPDFARRLSKKLKLKFAQVLEVVEERPSQKLMQNGIQQARNVDGAFCVRTEIPGGPVLLVDDIVDSRWTLTVAAHLLTSRGSGPVFPIALASTTTSDE